MPSYTFRVGPELIWTLSVAILTPLLLELAALDLTAITEVGAWNWAAGIAAGMVRAGAAALLALLGPGGFSTNGGNTSGEPTAAG